MNADYVWKLSKFGRLTSTRLRYDDDFADRLNYQFTGLLLFVFIGIIGIRQYVGKPIQCWTPQEFTRAWEEYAENYCWVASTYFIHLTRYPTSNILISQSNFMPNGYIDTNGQRVFQPYSIYPKFPKPKAGELPSDGQLISYYQWAPILLAVQSFLFYLPCLIWRLFSSQSGFQVKRIMQFASEAALAAPTEGDAPSQPQVQSTQTDLASQVKKRTSIIAINTTGSSSVPSFSATKSVKTLARYLDMCFMRQRELRRAVYLSSSQKPKKKSSSLRTESSQDPCRFYLSETTSGSFRHGQGQSNRVHSSVSSKTREGLTSELMEYEQNSLIQNSTKHLKARCLSFCCSFCKHCREHTSTSSYQQYSTKKLSQTGLPENFDMVTMPNSYYTGHKIFDDCSQTVNELSTDEPLHNSSTCCSCWSTGTRKRPQRTHISYVPPCKYQGNFLVRLYMLVKILYLSNVVGQIFLLEYYTGVEYNFYGIRVLYDLARGRQWEESGHFPRVTFCDFEAKKLAQSHYYTLQCVLPINMFLEKIYIFLWLWFFLVGVVTFGSIVIWIRRIGTKTFRFTWIQQQLITIRQFNKDAKGYEQFVDNHLGPDGVFILRLIAQNYGDLVAGDTIGELWVAYWQRRSTNLSERRPTDSFSRKPPSPASTFNRFDQSHPSDTYTKNPQSRNQRSGTYQMPMTLTRGQIENKPSRQGKKDKSRRIAAASGFPAALLATEMVHPVDRFGVPLIAATRKPPSLPSRSSSRYSERSRSRDRSESPPPIPQRSPGCENYSLSDRQSVKDFEHQSEHSSVIYPVSPTGADEEEIVDHPNEATVENDQIVDTQGSVEYEDPQGNIYTEDHDNQYIDDVQNDDNIV
ncbi:Innexin unc-9 [Schistosoma japonicum]|uniref:Innexin n=1 Tax=Schistosoma japonicum TaxID=6182 RepID=A0A4Z2DTM3_SCHJA|nr:Innexin unc-9 [Schistosoma japonicum]TNN19876.1 Innexin unc-9 [Schistosoma japonicum]